MVMYVPRTEMWLGAVYEALARHDVSPELRHEDWTAAAQHYSRASEEWQKLRTRPDIGRYQGDISESAKKVQECNRRANSRV
jgi:hypothetical protein